MIKIVLGKCILWSCVPGLLFFSCRQKVGEHLNNVTSPDRYPQTVELRQGTVKKFELDSVTAPFLYHVQFFVDEFGNKRLAYLNEETGSIYINDFDTGKIVHRIDILANGKPTKKLLQGFLIHNNDSVFVFAKSPYFMLVDINGKVVKSYNLMSDEPQNNNFYSEGIFVRTSNQVFFRGPSSIYFSSLILNDYSKYDLGFVQGIFDLEKHTVELGNVNYPEVYATYHWGGAEFLMYSQFYNKYKNQIVFSFPVSHEVLIYDIGLNTTFKKQAGSKYIASIPYMDLDKFAEDKLGKLAYFIESPSYGAICYDRYRDIYYRVALLPSSQKSQFNYNRQNDLYKTVSVMTFDADFNYLGESVLEDDQYWTNNFFVTSDGLYIQNKANSDSTLDFTLFKVVQKQRN